VGSALTAMSVGIGMLVVARGAGPWGIWLACGIGGRYFGVVEVVWALGNGMGLSLGGVFTEKVTWPW
jgi:hypothetical protein